MKYLFLFILLTMSLPSSSSQFFAQLTLSDSSQTEINIGDATNMKLVIWPVSENLEVMISDSLMRADFISDVFIVEVLKVERAPENYEALVIDLNGVFTDANQSPIIKVDQYSIILELINFVVKSGEYTNQVMVAYKNYVVPSIWRWFFVLLFVLAAVVIILFAFKKMRSKRQERLKREAYKKRLTEKLKLIDNRSEIEEFVVNAQEYRNELEIAGLDLDQVVEHIHSIQYKKKWSTEEMNTALELIKKIRNSLK